MLRFAITKIKWGASTKKKGVTNPQFLSGLGLDLSGRSGWGSNPAHGFGFHVTRNALPTKKKIDRKWLSWLNRRSNHPNVIYDAQWDWNKRQTFNWQELTKDKDRRRDQQRDTSTIGEIRRPTERDLEWREAKTDRDGQQSIVVNVLSVYTMFGSYYWRTIRLRWVPWAWGRGSRCRLPTDGVRQSRRGFHDADRVLPPTLPSSIATTEGKRYNT